MSDDDQPEGPPREGDAPPPDDRPGSSFPLVIGVAASATDVESLFAFLETLDAAEAATVLCVAQQEAIDGALSAERITARTGLPVTTVSTSGEIAAGIVYLTPADGLVTLEGGRLALRPSPEPIGERGRIDSLLVSIAEAQREHAVAVVLAGVGSDGTLGATSIKEHGGLVIAQPPPEGLRPSALAHGAASTIADYLLPAEAIADRIADYRRHLARLREERSDEAGREEIRAQLGRVATVLRNKTGHDFHGYKHNTFMRRVQRRMQVVGAADVDAYLAHMREDADEAQHLFNDLLIGVTQFFRDKPEFEIVARDVIPNIFAGKTAADNVRVWVLGCATGEEAYSLAILMREHMATLDAVPHVQIFATDIDGRALASARVGRFAETIRRDVSEERLARWFAREGDTYCVVKELREMCIFSQHNLIRDAPFSRLDLVSCRNLLIYLNAELQDRVIPLFHFSLAPQGYLFLGNSENITRHGKLFAPVDRRCRIFRRIEVGTRVLPDFPLSPISDRRARDAIGQRQPRPVEGTLARRAERIAERYAPAYVVVDGAFDALHFSGRTGRFLDPLGGVATLGLLNLVHRDLRLELRTALHKAAEGAETIIVPPVRVTTDGETMVVHMAVEPVVPQPPGEPRSYVVVFRDGEKGMAGDEPSAGMPLLRDEHVQRLESELRLSRERLQATIEELESTNEELKSSNEEYQSINEELQSANEELETSREELQSINEELQTVNGELAHRVQELGRANSDVKNLLESTQIATIFLDNDLRVKTFTPAVTEIFHLIDSDLGRPMSHIAGKLSYDELAQDIRRVTRTLTMVEREMDDPRSGSRFLVRLLPYRSIDNFIAGVVLTFLDITAVAKAESALGVSEERFRMMAQAVPIILFTADANFAFDYVNDRFSELTGMAGDGAIDHGWLAALHPADVDRVQQLWRAAAAEGSIFECECRLRDAGGGYRWMLLRADAQRGSGRWSGSFADIHALRRARERQTMLTAELQHRVKNILSVVRSIFSRTIQNGGSTEELIDHFRGRLDALGRTQSVVARTPEGSVDLEDLVRDELLSLGAKDGPQLAIGGPPVRLRQKAIETMGLAVHELATNAAKYGALAFADGRIDIRWSLQESPAGQRLAFEWRESGVAMLTSDPPRTGFGRELIEQALPYQLGATTALEFAPGGIRCTINLPVPAEPDVPILPLVEAKEET